ncbi:MAG: hypothetical protein ACRDHC_07065 [Actinomycetota bacterium]
MSRRSLLRGAALAGGSLATLGGIEAFVRVAGLPGPNVGSPAPTSAVRSIPTGCRSPSGSTTSFPSSTPASGAWRSARSGRRGH